MAILRLLNSSSSSANKEINNNLIQIGTGEGKSIILAVVSCLLALVGFDVSCACYSEYLSKRDSKNFD